MARFSFLPQNDGKQVLRIRRYLLASGFSLLYLLVLFIFHIQGALTQRVLIEASVLIAFLIVLFYALLRSGLSLRMRDPSLTVAQMLCAVFTMLFIMYHAPATREAFGPFLYIAFMFGMLRLSTLRLSAIAVVALAAFAAVIALRMHEGQDQELIRQEFRHWMILVLTLPWFLLIGGYIRRLRRDLSEVSHRLDDAEQQARHDELTGALNRRAIMAALEAEKNRCDRFGEVFCVCIVDIDSFKRVNDQNGHLAGDEVLRRFAQGVITGLRATDTFGRYGGEEFVQLLAHTELEGALVQAERVRRHALSLDFQQFAKGCAITVSIGVAQYRPGESVTEILARADSALYEAKRAGRNRVVAWPAAPDVSPGRAERGGAAHPSS